jgi:hypothetical protein
MKNDIAKNAFAKAGFRANPSNEAPAAVKPPVPAGYPIWSPR